MIWSHEETLPRAEMCRLQTQRLQDALRRVWAHSPPYRAKMEAAGVRPEDIRDVEDLSRLPFTTKDDFRQNYPFGLLAVPRSQVVRLHASSGPTGKPAIVAYTKKDLGVWADLVARIQVMAGVGPEDVAQICNGYGMFAGGFGHHLGLEHLGAMVIPSSSGHTEKQILYLRDLGATVLFATPSYAIHLGEAVREKGLEPARDLAVRKGLFGGEAMTDCMRRDILRLWGPGFTATQNYGMSELLGPGVAGECLASTGLHIQEDHFIPEVVDPDTGAVLPPGVQGELVISAVTKDAMPLIRYRTRDITRLVCGPCPCGRTTVRMEPPLGRTDDMVVLRGVTVFPSQIDEVLFHVTGLSPSYQILLTTQRGLDRMTIRAELLEEGPDPGALAELVRARLREALAIDSRVEVLPPRTLERPEGKSRFLIDRRER